VVIHIAGYSVIGQIGRGGMATVYRARQTLLDREVALKVMTPQLAQDPVYAQRFLQEARMLAALNHPHVVPVYDIGVSPEGLHYFSMQMLGGGDFAARMRDGLSELELVRVLVAVAHALGFAHARGYVHRDVTPANIMFDAHDTPVLTDFGIARAVAATSRITAGGLSIGTSHYMSPEQARGAEVDHRSDIYSLGALCFEALAGQPPYDGEDTFAVAFAHVHDPIPRLPAEVARWQPLIDRAMAKDPAQRFADCAAFIEGLREVAPGEFQALGPAGVGMAGRTPSTLPSHASRAHSATSRPPLRVLALGAVAGVVIGLAAWLAMPSFTVAPVDGENATRAGVEPPAMRSLPDEPDAAALPAPAVEEQAPEQVEAQSEDPASTVLAADILPHTVVDPVATLVAMGRESLAALRLTQPPGNNAMERFRLALAIEPGNPQAVAGITEVAQRYLELASRRDPATEMQAWIGHLRLAEQVAAEHPAAAMQGARARAELDDFAAAQLARGRQAIIGWDKATASEAFGMALAIDPDNMAARAGLAEADRIGTVGYRFTDLGNRSDLTVPELVVVSDRLALGYTEVTVGQFRAYWDAAGKQRFGADLPACRDREATGLFHSTRGRSWTAPGIAQDDRHPVVCVSVAMAEAYVGWLSEQTGRRYRLPAAAELERLHPGVSAPCDANLRDQAYREAFGGREHAGCNDSHAATAPVALFPPTGPGLHDLRGNVREWSSDCAVNCRERMAVGLGWHSPPNEAPRESFSAEQAFNTIGLRVAREID
jgi:serine/threonine-protein kinase PpkA